jgi:hypothetical protein
MMIRRIAMMLAVAFTTFGTAQAADAPKSPTGEKGRDWTQIDTNKDGYIQPEEMEKWLAANPYPGKK